jgi:hypothetical protein
MNMNISKLNAYSVFDFDPNLPLLPLQVEDRIRILMFTSRSYLAANPQFTLP